MYQSNNTLDNLTVTDRIYVADTVTNVILATKLA